MKIEIYLIMFLFIITSVLAFGTNSWYQQANPLWLSPYSAYSNVYQNIWNSTGNESYARCVLPSTSFEPISADLNNDGIGEVVLINSGTSITIYDTNCNLIKTISGTYSVMPVLTNLHDNAYPEIVAVRGTFLDFIEFSLDDYIIYKSINYSGGSNGSTANYLTCDWLTSIPSNRNCLLLFSGKTYGTIVNYESNSASLELQAITSTSTTLSHIGFSSLRYMEGTTEKYTNLFCTKAVVGVNFRCDAFNESFGNNISMIFYPTTTDILDWVVGFPAYLGTTVHYFVSNVQHTGVTYRGSYAMFDNAGTLLTSKQASSLYPSNWIVTDYNKDGINEACIGFWDVAVTYDYMIKCFDASGGLVVSRNMTQCSDTPWNTSAYYSRHFIMADFKVNASTLGIATPKGIFYSDGSSCTQFMDTGYTGGDSFPPIVITESSIRQPILIYGDATSGFILRNPILSTICGNGICDFYENQYTCPGDCVYNVTTAIEQEIGDSCLIDSDCASNFCNFLHKCQLKGSGAGCSADDQCMSGECSNFKCTTPSGWDNINAAKTELIGDDIPTNNLISFILSLAFAAIILIGGVSLHVEGIAPFLASVIIFYVALTFFAIVGWVSAFIIVGLYVATALIIALILLMKPGG